MKVSVVITTCKRPSNILKRAIKSVVDQTYKNIELIIVNDAPNYEKRDSIEELINSYGSKLKYIVNDKTRGANYSRNIGAQSSVGDIISFLDDDDYWHRERIYKIVDAFKAGADVVYSDFYIVSNGKIRYSKRDNPPTNIIEMILAKNFIGGFSNVSFERNHFFSCGGLDESMPSYQDQDLFIRLLLDGKLGYINEGLSYYCVSSQSISLNSEKKLKGLKNLLIKYEQLFNQYPEAKRVRLESEFINSLKNGWWTNARSIRVLLRENVSVLRIIYLNIVGIMKYVAVHMLKI